MLKRQHPAVTLVISLLSALFVGVVPAQAVAGDCSTPGNANLTIVANVVTGSNGCVGAVVIPEGVTRIASSVFENNTLITGVLFPETLETIGFSAFAFTSITSLDIPASVVIIDQNAFKGLGSLNPDFTETGLSSLTSLTFGATSATTTSLVIADYAFENNSALTSVSFPANLLSIGVAAFDGSTALTSVSFSGSRLESLGESSFRSSGLFTIAIPSSITLIGESAFIDSRLTSITFPDRNPTTTPIEILRSAFENTRLTHIDLPEGLTELENSVFTGSTLRTVTFPSTMTRIGSSFRWSQLTNLIVPDGVTEVGNAFVGTPLTELNLPESLIKFGRTLVGEAETLSSLRKLTLRGRAPIFPNGDGDPLLASLTAGGSCLGDLWYAPELTEVFVTSLYIGSYTDADADSYCTLDGLPTWYGLTVKLIQASITYKANYTGAPADQIQSLNLGSTVISSSVARTGFTFVGWNTESNGSGTSIALSDTVNVSGDMVLHAQWQTNVAPTYSQVIEKPVVSLISQTVIPSNKFTSVTLVGQYLPSVTSIQLGNLDLDFTRNPVGEIVLALPKLTSGSYDLVLKYGVGESVTVKNAFMVSPLPVLTKVVRFSQFAGDSAKLPARATRAIGVSLRAYSTIDRVVCTGFTSGIKATPLGRKIALQRAQNACNVARLGAPEALIQVRANVASGVGPKFRSVQVSITGK